VIAVLYWIVCFGWSIWLHTYVTFINNRQKGKCPLFNHELWQIRTPRRNNFCSKQVNPIETYGNQRVKWEKKLQESKLRFWHRDCWFPCSPIKCQFYMYIPILQVSICRLFPCQLWSPLPLLVLSLHFRMPLFSASGGLHWICPNHLSRCWTNFYLIAATCTISHITSFLIRSFLVWLHIHISMRIFVELICCMCVLMGEHLLHAAS
jgi:hypothetical protein